MSSELKNKILEIVKSVPEGKLTTYGTVGKLAGISAQVVGWTMSGLTEAEMLSVPWPRVVAKGGQISTLKLGPRGLLHIALLEKEGHTIKDEFILGFEDCLVENLDSYEQKPIF